jgi:hypothetical protein
MCTQLYSVYLNIAAAACVLIVTAYNTTDNTLNYNDVAVGLGYM